MEKECNSCQTKFIARIDEHKRGLAKFCSRNCYYTSKKGLIPKNLNKLHTQIKSFEGREKIANHFKGQTPWNKGVELPQFSGDKNPNWKGGVTPIHKKIRLSRPYLLWRKKVIERDKYKCIWCGGVEKLEVDHIQSFAKFEELRFELTNGRTLCHDCHTKTPTYAIRLKYL